ncbi:hypothetical protein CLOM_g21583 [Closterium sp. NIES-68]|nr:hypothetical protein CLOM_g21583 [Closterium sp. NIES-68]
MAMSQPRLLWIVAIAIALVAGVAAAVANPTGEAEPSDAPLPGRSALEKAAGARISKALPGFGGSGWFPRPRGGGKGGNGGIGGRIRATWGVPLRLRAAWGSAKFRAKARDALTRLTGARGAAVTAQGRAEKLVAAWAGRGGEEGWRKGKDVWTQVARDCVNQLSLAKASMDEAAAIINTGEGDVADARISLSSAATLASDCRDSFRLFAPDGATTDPARAVQQAAGQLRAALMALQQQAADMAAMVASSSQSTPPPAASPFSAPPPAAGPVGDAGDGAAAADASDGTGAADGALWPAGGGNSSASESGGDSLTGVASAFVARFESTASVSSVAMKAPPPPIKRRAPPPVGTSNASLANVNSSGSAPPTPPPPPSPPFLAAPSTTDPPLLASSIPPSFPSSLAPSLPPSIPPSVSSIALPRPPVLALPILAFPHFVSSSLASASPCALPAALHPAPTCDPLVLHLHLLLPSLPSPPPPLPLLPLLLLRPWIRLHPLPLSPLLLPPLPLHSPLLPPLPSFPSLSSSVSSVSSLPFPPIPLSSPTSPLASFSSPLSPFPFPFASSSPPFPSPSSPLPSATPPLSSIPSPFPSPKAPFPSSSSLPTIPSSLPSPSAALPSSAPSLPSSPSPFSSPSSPSPPSPPPSPPPPAPSPPALAYPVPLRYALPPPSAIVAKDGSGSFTTIQAAVDAAPSTPKGRFIVFLAPGVYAETVRVARRNVTLVGVAPESTVITGSASVMGGSTTFNSATVAVSGAGFLAVGVRFENTAGAENHQAVALRVTADNCAFFDCHFIGWQDTLYAHSGRQYYRNCVVSGSIDFVFGNAAAVLDNCTLQIRPQPNAVVTASGRANASEPTGIVIVNSRVEGDLPQAQYLGRPWRPFARVLYSNTFIGSAINSNGWMDWGGTVYDTTTYVEYNNSGPGATGSRVAWAKPGIVTNASLVAQYSPDVFLYPFAPILGLIPWI